MTEQVQKDESILELGHKLPDTVMLKLMDTAVHKLKNINPLAHELHRVSHKKGNKFADHNETLATAFAAMSELLGEYSILYSDAIDQAEAEKGEKANE